MINIITTYYNNPLLMVQFIDDYLELRDQTDQFSLTIVDDGSKQHPIAAALKFFDQIPDLTVYQVTKDLGFNSHGCRNLAMRESQCEWNLLVDSDYDLKSLDLLHLERLDPNNFYQFSVNTLLITKQMFFSCKGYDEEFVNAHMGDRVFLSYLEENFNSVNVERNLLKVRRPGRNVIHTDKVAITTYDEDKRILYQPVNEKIDQLVSLVNFRYATNDFSSKEIVKFPWVKLHP